MTTGKTVVPFTAAERARTRILAGAALACAALGWLSRHSSPGLAAVGALAVYLLTGDRYQWIYIWRMTFWRDMLGLRVLLTTMARVWRWERQGASVVSRWAEVAPRHPHKKAFVMGDSSITFKEADELSNRVAWYFQRRGFRRGQVVALLMETRVEYPPLWLGLAKLGVTTALLNTSLTGASLLHCLTVAKCSALLFGEEMAEAVKEIQSDIGDMPLFQYNGGGSAATVLGAAPLAAGLREVPAGPAAEHSPTRPRDTLLFIYTSGTTGLPKAAVITNLRFLLIPAGVHASARLSAGDVVYDPLPLHHTAGGVLGVGQALIFGCTVVLRKKFSASNYWSDAARHQCTAAQYIGEICRYLLSTPPGEHDQAHQVRVMLGNGLRPQIWERFVQRFAIKRVVEFYGATEGNSNLVNLDSKVGAIGFLSRHVSSIYPLTIVQCDELTGEIYRDKNGRCIPCGPQEPGLFLGKIDSRKAILTFAGYADKTASEKKMVRNVMTEGDCYFNTGDILVMDHLGYIYFKDRTGDTFRWRGENVSTAEVEGVISTLVGLKDTIVYGVAIPNVEGKAGMAAIADPENKLDLQLLATGLRSKLPAFARPLFIRVLTEPPLTSTFKLIKKELLQDSFHVNKHSDPLFFLDQKTGEYVPLTEKLYDDIVKGIVRL